MIDRWRSDLRIALRSLARTPAIAVTATAILAVGIGMAIAMSTIVRTVIVQRLPVRNQQELVVLRAFVGNNELWSPTDDRKELRREARTLRDVAGVGMLQIASPNIIGDVTYSLRSAAVSGNFFELLGARPASFSTVLPFLRRAMTQVDPRLTIWDAHSFHDLLGTELATPRLSSFLLGAFALVALLLAAIGLYGVMAFTVREETREIGLRMALGAGPERVRRDVLGRALAVIALGGAAGLVGALASSRVLAGLLFQVQPADPVALGAACLLLGVVALAAAYLPARRATRVDPAIALRSE